MQLRRGSASIINAADLPLVDRALNRVLQDLHGLLERRATRDLRTGLLNRKVLLTRLRDALNHPTQNADGVVTLGLQVADYGEVLETYGQEAADSLLRRVAQGIRGVLGPERVLACVDESTSLPSSAIPRFKAPKKLRTKFTRPSLCCKLAGAMRRRTHPRSVRVWWLLCRAKTR